MTYRDKCKGMQADKIDWKPTYGLPPVFLHKSTASSLQSVLHSVARRQKCQGGPPNQAARVRPRNLLRRQKSVGAPPSDFRRATKSASSDRAPASIGGSSKLPMISLNSRCARSGVQTAPEISHASKLRQSLTKGA